MDWTSFWVHKHDDIWVGIIVLFIGWLAAEAYRRLRRKRERAENAASVKQEASPQMNQSFNPTITINSPSLPFPEPQALKNPSLSQIDLQNIEKTRSLLSSAIEQLRGEHFQLRFRWHLQPFLYSFIKETAGPDYGFLDHDLEQLRQELRAQISLLQDRVARYSHGLAGDETERMFWAQKPPPGNDLTAEIRAMDKRQYEVHQIAQEVCKRYDQLILAARRKA